MGSQKADVAYAGRTTYTAEDEIVFTLPSSGVQGCYVQVAVQSGPPGGTQVVSNFTSVAVDPTGPTCSDADGINVADISGALASKGSAKVASISLLSNFLNLTIGGAINLQWDNDTAEANVGSFSTSVMNESQGFTLSPSANSCTVSPFRGFPPPVRPGVGARNLPRCGQFPERHGHPTERIRYLRIRVATDTAAWWAAAPYKTCSRAADWPRST